jgi:predicted TIM-barrel fold metal-dependent hydrolase
MLIVDAQIHLWNAGNPTSPWHRQIPAYLKDDALKEMDAGGVDAAILTPHTPWDPNANELCMEAVRAHPDRFAIQIPCTHRQGTPRDYGTRATGDDDPGRGNRLAAR